MIDPLISLAFSVYSNKGVYALLLGSGISRAAGIPTGWDVVIDLIQKVAALEGQDASADAEGWYRQRFNEEPDYSKLLDALAKSAPERQQLLRGYFEPTDEEREQGLKTPTAAHKAIAELISRGYIRVVITTNFDRLLERALEEVGLVPIVISTTDAIQGAPPIQHNACTIIKVHGDYLDTRIKNTPAELEQYEAELNKLLDRVYDEYGLIISGWSGDWDIALRAAIERCVSRRFTTYWTSLSQPSDRAMQLITLRRGELITTEGADSFFTQLNEKVIALEDIAQPHPLSSRMAVATLKRYLVDERYRIALRDLIIGEVRKVKSEITNERFPVDKPEPVGNAEELKRRVKLYEGLTETLLHLLAIGCYWGQEQHLYLWKEVITQVANHPQEAPRSYKEQWQRLELYPGLLLTYASGIGAVINRRYDVLATILLETKAKRNWYAGAEPVGYVLIPTRVMEPDFARMVPGRANNRAPVSEEIYEVLRKPLDDLLPNDEDYSRAFDLFEAFLTLVFIHFHHDGQYRPWAPYGRFGYPFHSNYFAENSPFTTILSEAQQEGAEWGALKAGFFEGSVERLEQVKTLLTEIAQKWESDIIFGR